MLVRCQIIVQKVIDKNCGTCRVQESGTPDLTIAKVIVVMVETYGLTPGYKLGNTLPCS